MRHMVERLPSHQGKHGEQNDSCLEIVDLRRLSTGEVVEDWDRLIAGSPQGRFFHYSHWIKFLERYGSTTGSFSPEHLCVRSEGQLAAVLPLFIENGSRGESLPFGDYGGPVLSQSHDHEILEILLTQLLKRNLRHIQMKAIPEFYFEALRKRGFQVEPRLSTFLLDLVGVDEKELFSKLRRDAKRGIRRAKTKGLDIREVHEENDAIDLYYGLHRITADRISAPKREREFYQFLWEDLARKDLARITMAYDGEEVVAGLICMVDLHKGGTLHIYSNVSHTRAAPIHANDLLYWEALCWAIEHRIQKIDMGLSPLDPESSLCLFKQKWSTERRLIYFATMMNSYMKIRTLASTAVKKIR